MVNKTKSEDTIFSLNGLTNNINYDILKIKDRLISLDNYSAFQNALESSCNETEFSKLMTKKCPYDSKNYRKFIRAGIPNKFMKDVLLSFNKHETNDAFYHIKLKQALKHFHISTLGNYVPYYTNFNDLDNSIGYNYLNDQGMSSLKEILWIINSNFPNILFSPIIIKIVSLILIFCDNKETFSLTKCLIEKDYEEKNHIKLKWHFKFSYEDHQKLITSINECFCAKEKNSLFANHLYEISYDLKDLIDDIVSNFFINYLCFEGICILLPLFILEGVKPLYRITICLIYLIKDDLMKCKIKEEIIETARSSSLKISNVNELFENSYKLKLSKFIGHTNFNPDWDIKQNIRKRSSFYLPTFNEISNILTLPETANLWSMLPDNYKIKDAKKAFQLNGNNSNLESLYKSLQNFSPHSVILFFIQNENDEVIGGVISSLFYPFNKYISLQDPLLFEVHPKICFYDTIEKEELLYCDLNCIMIGKGKAGPSIKIENTLKNGHCTQDNCFGSSFFKKTNGNFQIKSFEIFILG